MFQDKFCFDVTFEQVANFLLYLIVYISLSVYFEYENTFQLTC